MPEWLEKLVTTGSPSAIFALMWFLEYQKGVKKDAKLEQLTERTLVLLTELKGMITGKKSG
jgi:hypothetical protein